MQFMKTKHKRGSVARVIHWVWFPALLGAAALAWSFGPHDFYDGGDGKWTQSLIRFYLNFVPPFHINALNPIEADFSQLYPFNLWLHPVNIQFTFLPFEVAMNSSMLTFLAVQALAMYTCARQLGIDRISAAIAAQCAIWFFPHFSYFAGVLPIYQLNPVGSVTISLFILLLVLPLQVGPSSSLRRVAATGLVATALIAYIVYNDPMTMGLLGFCMSPAFAVVILAPSNIRGTAARLAVFAIPACILGAAGIVHYIIALDYYTYRYFFSTEVPRVQAPNFVSILFFQKSSTITLASCALGLVLGVICTRGPALVAVAMGLITMVIVAVAGTIYLFSEFHWWLPLPMYIEHYSFAFILIGVVAGYSGFLQWLGRRYGAAWRPAAAAVPVITLLAVSVLPLAIV